MIDYFDEISALFDIYEKEERLTEDEIIERCRALIKKHGFDFDYIASVNDVVFNYGYSFSFTLPDLKKEQYDGDKYTSLITNASKSLNKTKDLIEYLVNINDHRLVFAALHAIKVKHLFSLGLLEENEWTKSFSKDSFKNLLFRSLEFEEHYNVTMDTLEKLGLPEVRNEIYLFWLTMEWLLWSIEAKDPKNGFIKANTIKIAFGIAPRTFFEHGNKKYYNVYFSKKLNDYLKLIDKDLLIKAKEKWSNNPSINIPWGYSALFNVLQ